MGISRTVSEINGDFSRNSQILPPRVFGAPAEGIYRELRYYAGVKNRMMALPGRGRSLTISSAVRIYSTNVSDRRTDGRTPDDNIDRAYA